MVYLSFLYFLIIKNKSRVLTFIIGLIFISSFFGVLIGKTIPVDKFISIINILFTGLILFLLTYGFNNYKNLSSIRGYSNGLAFKKLIRFLIIIGFIALMINLFIIFKAFNTLSAGIISVQEYKNEGGANDYLTNWVSPVLLMLSRLISPIGYITLGLHFYFLLEKKKAYSFIFLLISLNIPLLGFQGLSRSAAIQFIFTYFFYILFIYKSLSKSIKKYIFIFGTLLFIGIFSLLSIITSSRFSNYYNVPSESKIQNNITYSLFDYASQWNKNGIMVMNNFSHDKLMFGKATFPIVDFSLSRIGIKTERLADTRLRSLGDDYDGSFNGVVASLLYDFGYFFTFILSVLFFRIVKNNAPKKGTISLINFINYGILIPLPIMFFSNNVYSNLAVNIGILYILIFNFFARIVFK